ncbi:MAG: PaaI family thioesterase [Rhodobacterales bacterium]|jgi:uncharacterized protein (TIGR00369 family)|nr:PaaI family thioesterase [Rhodobacter sp.]HBN31163.1 thioesterase [Paracoccaceae bacterium]
MNDASMILDLDAIRHLTGLETMQAIVDGSLPPAPIATTMNFWMVSVGDGEAVFEGAPGPAFRNPTGAIHGGWYGAIMDSVLGVAVHTKMGAGQAYTTLEYKVNITRAIPVGMQVRAIGTTSHVGRSTAVAEAKLIGVEDGRLYATASTTCMVFAPNP